MPEAETTVLFVEEEYEQSQEGVDAPNNMKEVCQKPPSASVSKCLVMTEWNHFEGHRCSLWQGHKRAVLLWVQFGDNLTIASVFIRKFCIHFMLYPWTLCPTRIFFSWSEGGSHNQSWVLVFYCSFVTFLLSGQSWVCRESIAINPVDRRGRKQAWSSWGKETEVEDQRSRKALTPLLGEPWNMDMLQLSLGDPKSKPL